MPLITMYARKTGCNNRSWDEVTWHSSDTYSMRKWANVLDLAIPSLLTGRRAPWLWWSRLTAPGILQTHTSLMESPTLWTIFSIGGLYYPMLSKTVQTALRLFVFQLVMVLSRCCRKVLTWKVRVPTFCSSLNCTTYPWAPRYEVYITKISAPESHCYAT